ncbi:hypothetical protein [Pseudoduganella namucuonensis]|uniref:Secretion system X translation initiation factor n=1 Tax=Pseudoduganella namucuonensis TaxID=1035707 RepID=A0A1I7LY59_9BURK|nr:hypothetical protein [Pseudoduganella namucuonensis]SFV14636.1 hypothetical protein SAMN05216552_104316 [Pseudoduganella namucuonensis]
MTPRHMLMGAALVGAAALVLFGDKTPPGDVAEAVDRRAPAPAAPALAGAAGAPAAATGGATAAGPSAAAQPAAAAPAEPAPAPAPVRAGKGAAAADVAILRLIPRATLVGESGEGAFAANEGVFRNHNWTPPPPPPPPAPPPPPPPPPQAPPLPFTYLGKAATSEGWEVFLARGADRTYVVRNQMVIEGVYRVDAISPPTLKITYLPLSQVQQLNIGASD